MRAHYTRWLLLYLAVGALSLSPGAHSGETQCVFAGQDLVTGATVRATPSTNAARLSVLLPGQSLPYLGSQASWYQVQVADQKAYISKRWTRTDTCPPAGSGEVAAAVFAAAPSANDGEAAPVPWTASHHTVDWWFVFKLNAAKFPGCGTGISRPSSCPFGGTVKNYSDGQQFVFASSENASLQQGAGCAGTTEEDPIGATFDEIYNGHFFYLVWNDQFKGDPNVTGCGANCGSPWGHSKGLLAWNHAGAGVVLQVTTPSWPGAGNQEHARQSDGNTLGCVTDDNVLYSQHFFALRLTKDDLLKVLQALQNASVGTDPDELQIVSTGGPPDVQAIVASLGKKSSSARPTEAALSSGIRIISKPSALHVPPWQLVSSLLGSVPLRVASWWTHPSIPSTTQSSSIGCWDSQFAPPGPVQIATSGTWTGTIFGLKGATADGNHAKIGISTDDSSLVIFGDMNQQGSLSDNCASSQNGRGGLFFVLKNAELFASVAALISGSSGAIQ